MNDIDDILSRYGISSNRSPQQIRETAQHQDEESESQAEETMDEQENEENLQNMESIHEEEDVSRNQRNNEDNNLTDDDLDDILQEHGFTQDSRTVMDEYLDTLDNEEHQDMEGDNANEGYDENQGEGHDDEESVVNDLMPTETERQWASGELNEEYHEERDIDADMAETTEESNDEGLLPLNSPTLLINDGTSRFSGTEWYNKIQEQRVILAGLGGIGSSVAYNIARMHLASLVLYDDDVVDWSNLSGQFYSQDDVGKSKVDAAEAELRKYATTENIYAIKEKFTNSSEAGDIMICGFDNMAARKTFFKAWSDHVYQLSNEERHKCLFLDGRLSISVMQVFCITGDDEYNMQRYNEKYLFSDAEADPQYNVCSLKQTTYLASMIGALMTNLFTNFTANLLNPIIPYTLPFFTEYDAQYMIFKEVN